MKHKDATLKSSQAAGARRPSGIPHCACVPKALNICRGAKRGALQVENTARGMRRPNAVHSQGRYDRQASPIFRGVAPCLEPRTPPRCPIGRAAPPVHDRSTGR